MPSLSPQLVISFNAVELLGIKDSDKGFCCVGHAPSKGRRCHNPIAAHDRQTAGQLFDTLPTIFESDIILLQSTLAQLARLCICKNRRIGHQSQCDGVVGRWTQVISHEVDRQKRLHRASVLLSPDVQGVAASYLEAFGSGTSLSGSPPRPRRPAGIQPQRHAQPDRVHPPPTEHSEVAPVSASEQVASQAAQDPQDPPALAIDEAFNESSSGSLVEESSSEESSNDSEDDNDDSSANRGLRKPIEGDCPICLEELEPSQAEQIVYCRRQCGNNLHRHCFDQWAMSCDGLATCPYCRCVWEH